MADFFIPGLSPPTIALLQADGVVDDDSLEGFSIARLIDAGANWSQVKRVIVYAAEKNRHVAFERPGDDWTEDRWQTLITDLAASGIVTWEEVAVCVLGELNPPQVGTSIATNKNIQKQYPPRKTMTAVMQWFYDRSGTCTNCGRRTYIEIDHIEGKDAYVKAGLDVADADRLDNYQLLCRRCNVIKRESHKLGGLSFATAQAALMWILLVLRPASLNEYKDLCRKYGLTMADVRFQEAWAMAIWLAQAGLYELGAPPEEIADAAAQEAEGAEPEAD